MSDISGEIEYLTHLYGSEIFARLDTERPIVFSSGWFDERLMEWFMQEEAIKVQMFRFIDVLPMLDDAEEVSRHLREYFAEAGDSLPGWMQLALKGIPKRGPLARFMAYLARSNGRRMARKFIAGSNIDEALRAVGKMRKKSLAFTVDLLGEACITEEEAQKYLQAYLDLITGLTAEVNDWPVNERIDRDHLGPIPRVNVSVKLSSLFSQFDPIDPEGTADIVKDRLRPILRLARQRQAFINIDMEHYADKDLTLRILKEILTEPEFIDWPDVGVAIQAYLKDTEKDLQSLLHWVEQRGTPLWVRLVKGAYWDYETVIAAQEDWPVPVFTDKSATDANYEKLTRFLLEHYELLRPAFGSHNVRSLAHAMATAQVLGLPNGAYEIQMLYGMADPFLPAMVSFGQRVRVYTPYGELLPGMAYLVRRLLENTANSSFLRASFTEHISEKELLMNPTAIPKNGLSTRDWSTFRNEPLTDFNRPEKRQHMQEALQDVRQDFGEIYPLVIGGEEIHTKQTITSVNPCLHSETVGRTCSATIEHAEQAIATAKEAFPDWRDTDPVARAAFLHRTADVMRQRRFELAAWQVFECGKQWREADADVAEAIDFCDYYAEEMKRLAIPHRVHLPGEENDTIYEPRGVAVVIAPWNFPLAILTGMTAAALVTGNTVIMKPAEQSSVMAAKLMEIFRAIDLPDGVVNFLPGIGEDIGPTLTNHPDVALIAFTGSRNVGLLINKQAADQTSAQDHVKRVLAEMGGKNAIIVDSDADLDEAVAGVAGSAFGYQGQKCSACSRAIVLQSIHDVFLDRLIEATKSLPIGPAVDPGNTVGAVIDDEAQKRILHYIDRGKEECRLAYVADVGELAGKGYFVGPHIFADVAPTATIAQEEIFGPVLAVIKAGDLQEALTIANGTPYALTGGIYTRSPANLQRVKREFRVGNLYINRKITGALVNRQPFGGFKLSGIGSKSGGPDYLLLFMVPRTITENTMRRGFAPEAD